MQSRVPAQKPAEPFDTESLADAFSSQLRPVSRVSRGLAGAGP